MAERSRDSRRDQGLHIRGLSIYLLSSALFWLRLDGHPISHPLIAWERSPGVSDILYPSFCPSKCKEDFGAESLPLGGSGRDKCACICPEETPIFHSTHGLCASNFAECPHPIHFSSQRNILPLIVGNHSNQQEIQQGNQPEKAVDGKAFQPTFRLPISGGIVNPRNALLWHESEVNLVNNCRVSQILSDTIENGWRPVEENLFALISLNNNTLLKWMGSEAEARLIEGSAIQMQLECPGGDIQQPCILFRIAGRSEAQSARAVVTGSSPRSNVTIIIVLCILLVLSIVGSIVAWNVCWRMKKERLVHEIQMQFLVHFRQQHDEAIKAATMAAMAQRQPPHPSGALSHSEFSPLSNPQPMQPVPAQKRKLYFSIDFFDPHLMVNPPPMAEQFLYDLRKMIDVAKERIRLKRHIPQLPGIVEEDETPPRESLQNGEIINPFPIHPSLQNASNVQQESPRSGKSVDSGHESPEESGESMTTSSEGSDEEKTENQKKESEDEMLDGGGQVRRLVNGFEAANSPTITPPKLPPKPQQSRIPTLSPKTPRAALSLGANSPNERMIPIKQIPIPSSPSGLNAYRKTKNKGYAVFPVDPMLKKSLPRRPKRDPTQQRNREVEKI